MTIEELIAKYSNDPRFTQIAQNAHMIPDQKMQVEEWAKKHGDLLNNPAMPAAVRDVIGAEGKTKTAQGTPMPRSRPPGADQKTMLFLHGMQSRYGKTTPAKVEADARKYAESRGMNFEAIPISGDKRQAQFDAATKRLGRGDVGAVLGFSAGGYNAAKLKTPQGVEKIIVGAPRAKGNQTFPGRHMDQVGGLTRQQGAQVAPQTVPRDVGDARAYLAQTAHPGGTMGNQGTSASIGRLHPEFASRLQSGIAALRANGYPDAGIASAYRSGSGTYGTGSKFDRAGQSLHMIGAAVDLAGIGDPGTKRAARAHQILAQNGVYGVYGPNNRAEYNHFQLVPQKSVSALGGDPAVVRKMAGTGAPSDMSDLWRISRVGFGDQPKPTTPQVPTTPVMQAVNKPQSLFDKPQEKLFPPDQKLSTFQDQPRAPGWRDSTTTPIQPPRIRNQFDQSGTMPGKSPWPTQTTQPTTLPQPLPQSPIQSPQPPQPPGQVQQIRPDSVPMPVGGDAPTIPQPMQPPAGPGLSFGPGLQGGIGGQGFAPPPMPMPSFGGGFGGGGFAGGAEGGGMAGGMAGGMGGGMGGGGGGGGGIGKGIAAGAQTFMQMMPKPIKLTPPPPVNAFAGDNDFAQRLMQFLQG